MYNCHGGRWLWWVICLFIPTLITITLFTWLDTSKDTYRAMKKPDWLPHEMAELLMSAWFGFSIAHGAAAIMIVSKKTPNERWKCPMLFAFAVFLTFFYAWPFAYFFIVQPFVTFLIACLAAVSAFIVLGLFIKLYDFAGILMLPSALWFTALSVFSYYLWTLNKDT